MMRTGIAAILLAAMLPAATAQPDPVGAESVVVREPDRALVQVAVETPERRAIRERAESLQKAGQAAPRTVILGDGAASLTLLDGEAFIAQPDADWLRSEVWKQETRAVIAGLLLSPDGAVTNPLSRHASIAYSDTGEFTPVEEIDPDWTLFDLQASADERLADRPDGEAVSATWAAPPVIDRERQVFRFLVRFSRDDGGGVRHAGTILKSGRTGVLVATLPLAEQDAARFEALAAGLEQRLDFNPGYRAEDFNPATDRKAEARQMEPDGDEPVDAWTMIATAALILAGAAIVLVLNERRRKSG